MIVALFKTSLFSFFMCSHFKVWITFWCDADIDWFSTPVTAPTRASQIMPVPELHKTNLFIAPKLCGEGGDMLSVAAYATAR
jgi:hypothetical protein